MCYRRLLVVLLVGVLIAGGEGSGAWAQTSLSPGAALPAVDAPLHRLDGQTVRPRALLGETATVFLFWSNQCPWVDRYEARVERLAGDVTGKGVRVVLVNANDADATPEESLQASRSQAQTHSSPALYVRDPTAAFARALGATRTPQAFVFDRSGTLAYVGAIDDSPSGAERVDTRYLRTAVEALVDGRPVPVDRKKAFGCALQYSK